MHTLYTYARIRTNYVNLLTGSKSCTTYAPRLLQPSQTNWQEKKYFKHHGTRRAGQVHMSQLWLDQGKKGHCTHKSLRLNVKGGAIVTRGWCHSVISDSENEDSTSIKWKIRILDHPKNLIKFLRARLVISQGLTGNNITPGPNQYRFTRTFLDGETLRIFDLKSTELRHETVANLIIVINHVVVYFGPKECLFKDKRYIRYKMEKTRKLTTRKYVVLVRDIN